MQNLRIICLLVVLAVAGPAWAQPKIGVIDMTKVFDNFYKTKAAKTSLNDYIADLDKEGQAMLDDLKKANEDYTRALADSNNQAVSADERDKAKKVAEAKFREVQEKQTTIEQFKRSAEARVREKRRQAFEKIMEEIRTVVTAQAKAATCTIVVDSTAETMGGTPMVLYNNGDNDLTSSVLAQLNTTAPAAGTTAPKPDDKKKP